MKLIITILSIVLYASFSFATGYSTAQITIVPVAETASGKLICKWESRINPRGAGMVMPYHLGWICVDSSGIQLEINTAVLSNQGLPILPEDSLILDQFKNITEYEDIPDSLISWIDETIFMIDTDSSWNRRIPYQRDSLRIAEPTNDLYSVHNLQSDTTLKYDLETFAVYEGSTTLYSKNGIELIHCIYEEEYINGVFFQEAKDVTAVANHTREDGTPIVYDEPTSIELYHVDAFRFTE